MSSLCYFGLFAHHRKFFYIIMKPLCSLPSQKLGLLRVHSRKELNINYKKNYYEKDELKERICTNVHVHGYRYLRRRPIKVMYHEKYEKKTLDDYVKEAKTQAPEIPDNDEVIQQPKVQQPSLEPFSVTQQMPKDEDLPSPLENQAKEEHSSNRIAQLRKEEEDEEKRVEKKVLRNLTFKLYLSSPHKVRSLMEQVKSSKKRKKNDVFLLEGWRLIVDAFTCGLKPKAIFYSRSRIFLNMIPLVSKSEKELVAFLNLFPLYKTPYKVFKLWSSLTSPPGIMAVFPLSSAEHMCSVTKESSFPLTVILDEIRDPNNLGSIIRTLAAAGVYKVIMMKGCCDLWDLKVIRSASGAHFHLHCLTGVTWNTIETHLDRSSSCLFLADACRNTSSIEDDEDEDSEKVHVRLRKELWGGKSYEELKELGRAHSERDTYFETNEDGTKTIYNESFNIPSHLMIFEEACLPQLFYNEIKFYREESEDGWSAVLILGGETGLSSCAKKFAIEKDGVQLAIPLLNKVESLNSAVATGILVYEMQKQYMAKSKLQSSNKTDNNSCKIY